MDAEEEDWASAPQAVSALEKAFRDALAVMPLERVLMTVAAMFPSSPVKIDTAEWHPVGPFRKVSVSMPEGLIDAVRERTGPGEFSRYVTEAVVRQHKQDLLADLDQWLEAEYGPIPADSIEWAERTWPDFEEK